MREADESSRLIMFSSSVVFTIVCPIMSYAFDQNGSFVWFVSVHFSDLDKPGVCGVKQSLSLRANGSFITLRHSLWLTNMSNSLSLRHPL